jgi:hypothetical protein
MKQMPVGYSIPYPGICVLLAIKSQLKQHNNSLKPIQFGGIFVVKNLTIQMVRFKLLERANP